MTDTTIDTIIRECSNLPTKDETGRPYSALELMTRAVRHAISATEARIEAPKVNTAPAACSSCPVCKFQGEPECHETWNGLRGPAARVVSRKWSCPTCGVVFAHPDGWKSLNNETPETTRA